jgi:ribose transport system substrate-binding protein
MKFVGVSLCVVVALALGLTACGGGDSSESKTGAVQAKKHYDLTFVSGNTTDPYFITMACGIQRAARTLNVSVTTTGPTVGDVVKSVASFNAAVAKHPDAIIMDAPDDKAFTAPVRQAVRDGIKVLFVNSAPTDTSIGSGFVATDDKAGGVLAGKEMLRLLGDRSGTVMSLGYNQFATLKARQDGFSQTVADDSKLKYVGNFFDPQNDAAKQAGMVSANLAKHPDLLGIYTLFGDPGTHALTALGQVHKVGKVKLISFDSSPALVADLKAGSVQGLVVQQAAQIGKTALEQTVDVLGGAPPKGTTLIPPKLITTETLAGSQQYLYRAKC